MAALTPGTHLGPYEILDAIGAGGMGEVYKARDTRLDRIVAIKVLSESLAADASSRERFEREAKAISSLNHPNICVLHDVGRQAPAPDTAPVDFLVLEFLVGESLGARLARGPVKVAEALAIAAQIASALDRAHRQGIVHRDLKPGNVMLTKSGVKLLDFGLARLQRQSDSPKDAVAQGLVKLADLTLPTMTSPLTMKGAVLGTLQYMSPEQLEGKDVDARADIFALGNVLYEMLTRRRPFEGKSQASLIGAILDHQPPPVSASQKGASPLLDEIVSRCLAKDPDHRWQSASDVKHQLEWLVAQPSNAIAATSGVSRVAMIGTAIAAVLITAGFSSVLLRRATALPPIVARFSVDLPEDQAFTRAGRRVIALSPDGTRLVYVANRQIYLRNLNDLSSAALPGTAETDPSEPTFSPDGQWLAFWSAEQIKKVPIGGGTPVVVGPAQNPYGLTWEGDRLLFGQTNPNGIVEMPANGGAARLLVAVDEKKREITHGPQLIDGGRAVLFTLQTGDERWDDASIVIQDLQSGARSVLVKGGTSGRLLPTGHLVYARESTLFAAAFDAKTRAIVGATAPVQQEVALATAAFSGAAQMAWSERGDFAFLPNRLPGATALAWVDAKGKVELANLPARQYQTSTRQMALSPDRSKAAITILATGDKGSRGQDVWIWDMARSTATRLTNTSKANSPVWTPDGRQVCSQNDFELVCQDADGGGQPRLVASIPNLQELGPITADGKEMIVELFAGPSNIDIMALALDGSKTLRPILTTAASEEAPRLSPDEKWLAYVSNESGNAEVYVRPYPNVSSARSQISNNGGAVPAWSRDQRQLYYLHQASARLLASPNDAARPSTESVVMAAPIAAGSRFIPGTPVPAATLLALSAPDYEVGADGRFLVKVPAGNSGATPRSSVIVVQNWFEELNQRVPVRR